MRTRKEGFIVPLLLVIIALVLVGGVTYLYMHNKQASQSAIVNPPTPTTKSTTTVASTSASIGTETFSASPTSGKVPLTVKFSAPFSQLRDSPLVVFGDGFQAYMSCPRDGCVTSNTYTNAGTYTVRFMVDTEVSFHKTVANTVTITVTP